MKMFMTTTTDKKKWKTNEVPNERLLTFAIDHALPIEATFGTWAQLQNEFRHASLNL